MTRSAEAMTTVLSADTPVTRWLIDQSLDQLLERYVDWREECLSVRLAYEFWGESDRAERKLAHAGYLAALDREQQAARVYAEQIEWVRRVQTSSHAPPVSLTNFVSTLNHKE